MAYEKEKKTAVALEYTPGEQAPKVIASGRGYPVSYTHLTLPTILRV